MKISVVGVGSEGILRDPPGHALPPSAWTAGRNVRFDDGVVMPSGREFDILGPLQIPPYGLYFTSNHWLYAGPKTASTMGVWAIDVGNTHTELTTVIAPTWSDTLSILTGGVINGLATINNVTDSPAYWQGVTPVNKLQWLTWDATDDWKTKNWTTQALRAHKRWLFALGTVEAGVPYPKRIRNSASAPPGALPATWDDTDLTADAAFVDDLAAERYDLIDGFSLGDEFVAYTEQTTWIGQATGNNDAPFRFRRAFDFMGLFSANCAVAQGRRHFLLTQEDLVVHDGSSATPLLKGNNRRWLFRNIDVTNRDATFLFYSRPTNELLICFPEQGATHCTKALIVNLTDNSRIGVRDLPALRDIDMGPGFGDATTTYDEATFSYGASDFPYSQGVEGREVEKRVAASPDNQNGLVCLETYADVLNPAANTPQVVVERSHLTFPGEARVNLQDGRVLRCTAIYPTFSRKPDGPVNVYLGTSNSAGGQMTWHGPQVYDPNTTRTGRVLFREQGRYLGVRFETNDGADWQLSGYDMDITPLGYRT